MTKTNKSVYIGLQYMAEYFLSLLTIALGVFLVDAFTEGKNYLNHWLILLFIGLPLFMIGRWAIDKNKKKCGE